MLETIQPEQILNELVKTIANRPCPPNVICQIGVAGGKVLCLPRWNNVHDFRPIAELRPSQMDMTPAQWKRLSEKLARAMILQEMQE
jgi:hypothetical protein